jgi:dTDP-4-dehydrorhamnose reductase
MCILVFGGSGLLGSHLVKFFHEKNIFSIKLGYQNNCDKKVNLGDVNEVFSVIKKYRPSTVINCAANVDVDACNSNLKEALEKNYFYVKNIIDSIQKLKVHPHFIHISTDQLYNNKKVTSSNRENQINISNNYSISKYLGEKSAATYSRSLILRTNFFGKSFLKHRKSYSDWIIANIKNNKKIYINRNIYFNPIHINILCEIISKLIIRKERGIYNVASKDGISKYKFALNIVNKFFLNKKYILFRDELNNRPQGTIMNVSKIEKKLKISMPTINQSLDLL